jgi:hypothetical protein
MKQLWFIPLLLVSVVSYAATYSGTATGPELDYVHGVTSGIQSQLNAKAPTTTTAVQASIQTESYTAANDTGSANAYAITVSPAPTLSTYSWFSFKAANANTGASTLAVNGGAANNIYKWEGTTPLIGGEIVTGQIVRVIYDGTNFQMQSQSASLGAASRIVGSGLTAGTVYYMSSGGLAAAEANSSSTLPCVCIADTTTTCLYNGVYKFGSSQSWTVGNVLYVSATSAGAIVNVAPSTSTQLVQRIGVALANDTILFTGSLTQITVP